MDLSLGKQGNCNYWNEVNWPLVSQYVAKFKWYLGLAREESKKRASETVHIHVRWTRVYNYILILGYVNDLALCCNMAKKEMDCLTFHRISHWSIILAMPCQ